MSPSGWPRKEAVPTFAQYGRGTAIVSPDGVVGLAACAHEDFAVPDVHVLRVAKEKDAKLCPN